MTLEIDVLACDSHINVAGSNRLMVYNECSKLKTQLQKIKSPPYSYSDIDYYLYTLMSSLLKQTLSV